MLFKFLEKPIEITAFLPENYAFIEKYSPIETAAHFVPNFWKNIPKMDHFWQNKKYYYKPTVKSCVGIIKTFQNGLIMPMWCDLSIKIHEDLSWTYQFSDKQSTLDIHDNNQIPNFYTNHWFFKLKTPWILRTSEKINFLVCDPTFFTNEKKYFTPTCILPTLINNDYIFNIFLFIKKKPDEIFINFNTPLQHIIPITEKKFKFKVEVISFQQHEKIMNYNSAGITFSSAGLNILKILRKQKNG